jgi:hypothetical protein
MALAQLTCRESLRDIEACLRSLGSKLYNMGFRGNVSRISRRSWFRSPGHYISAIRSVCIRMPAFMPWTRPPSTYAFRFSAGALPQP